MSQLLVENTNQVTVTKNKQPNLTLHKTIATSLEKFLKIL